MDRHHFLKSSLTAGLLAGITGRGFSPEGSPSKEELNRIWQISGEMTLKFAEAMPAGGYPFRPTGVEEIYTYGGQMQHIAENIIGLFTSYLTDIPAPDIQLEEEDNKAAILEHIHTSFEYGSRAIDLLTGEKMIEIVDFFARPLPRWHVLFIAQDHTTHHLGQAVIYLNAKGIRPPSYRKW